MRELNTDVQRRASVTALDNTPPTQYGIQERGHVAQRLERRTHNPPVPGSNPGVPTTLFEKFFSTVTQAVYFDPALKLHDSALSFVGGAFNCCS